MNLYFKALIPNKFSKKEESCELDTDALTRIVWEYLHHYYFIRMIINGFITWSGPEDLYVPYNSMKSCLNDFKCNEVPFKYKLKNLELTFWEYIVEHEYPYFEKLRPVDDFKKMVETCIAEYKNECDEIDKVYRESKRQSTEKVLDDQEYASVNENIKKLREQCKKITDNMLSMIYKIEKDNIKKESAGTANKIQKPSCFDDPKFVQRAVDSIMLSDAMRYMKDFFETDQWNGVITNKALTQNDKSKIKEFMTSGIWIDTDIFDYNHKPIALLSKRRGNIEYQIYLYEDINEVNYRVCEVQEDNKNYIIFSKFYKNIFNSFETVEKVREYITDNFDQNSEKVNRPE